MPCTDDTTAKLRPAIVRRLRARPRRSTSTVTLDAVELDLVARRPDPPNVDAVRPAAVAQLDLMTDLHVDERAATAGPAEEDRPARRSACRSSASIDGGDEGDVGQAGREVLVGRGEPVEPRRVELAAANLGSVEQVEQERLVRRAAVDQHRHLRQRPVQAGERLGAVTHRGR